MEIIRKIIGYLNGLILKLWIHSDGLFCSRGLIKIYKKNGIIEIGHRTTLWPNVKLTCVSKDKNMPAVIKIGRASSIGNNTQIHCAQKVEIGNYVLISWGVNIIENEMHALGGGEPVPNPIIIEDEVWIGCNVIILKGVRIGKGATIGAGSVVTHDIPSYTLAAGNPAKAIKKAKSWRSDVIEI